jgi:hypothetical protein
VHRLTEPQLRRVTLFLRARPGRDAVPGHADDRARAAPEHVVAAAQAHIRLFLDHDGTEEPLATIARSRAATFWDLLVDTAGRWRDHPGYPADAAVHTRDLR